MSIDEIRKLSRADALEKLEQLKEGRGDWAKDFNKRYFKAQSTSQLKDASFDEMRALTAVAFAPESENERVARLAEQAKRKAEGPTPEQKAEAEYQIGALKGDPEFWRRFKASDPHVVKAWNSLHEQAYGNEPAQAPVELGASIKMFK